jgi:pimeloyl-ACP methyl ester carboxylesterase
MPVKTPLGVNRTVSLNVHGSTQQLRICGARADLPPLLVVQGGPGLPLLHEVPKFQRLLHLEDRFLVGYWEQRACGDVPSTEAEHLSWPQQIEDLRTVLEWFHGETKQRLILLGISIGGTMALRAAADEGDRLKAVIAVSPDSSTDQSDAAVDAFLRAQVHDGADRRIAQRIEKLPRPPYFEPNVFQQRARVLADLGTIEYGRTFGALAREMLIALLRAYGVTGAFRALRNFDRILHRLLPEVASLNLFADPPRVTVPVHYVFGERDVVAPVGVSERLAAAIAAPASTVARVARAGHMAHFDRPDVVRAIADRL